MGIWNTIRRNKPKLNSKKVHVATKQEIIENQFKKKQGKVAEFLEETKQTKLGD
jgi:hypothetical protein